MNSIFLVRYIVFLNPFTACVNEISPFIYLITQMSMFILSCQL